ncbi:MULTISPECIES: NifB/NifX family molybdenum-iron cluster-binding protein [Kamptonema]|uniref:NifB/NifX family molybdenum-iron cluster-binding protein n=1 Tax=Kamptonema TaxID=1501433 RepID=UPI0001DACAB9|nr:MULTISPECIES: NifB/NifX family molybdenum-iron cluster-binding protein [Kamptonema]CBN55607.1 putative Dinitrogenase iron-molybdenum cofactor [Kamptonema sp. PCC 6506]
MKIALASQNKTAITEHAGHCRKFWIYETNATEILGKQLLELSPAQSFHDSSPDESHPLDDIQVLIAGGMGRGLVERLERKGIAAIVTKETDLDKAVSAYLDGSLVREEAECHEHGGEHKHEEKHDHKHRHEHGHQHHHECAAEGGN